MGTGGRNLKRSALVVGAFLTVAGGLSFIRSMQMLFEDILTMDWAMWTLLLTFGIVAVSVGPTVLIFGYARSIQTKYGLSLNRAAQQTFALPQYCPQCNNEIRLNHLEWIGEEEARCPYCSAQIPVRRNLF